MTRLFGALALGLFVAGCASMPATPYQPYRSHSAGGIHGGYSEQQLAPGRYLVRFHGNSVTARDRVEGYMLYRAADLTVQKGFDWFLVQDHNTEHTVHTIVRPDPFYHPWFGAGYGAWRPEWNVYMHGRGWVGGYGDLSANTVVARRIEAFEATAEILMHKGPVPADEPQGIDAHKVLADLGPTIEHAKS